MSEEVVEVAASAMGAGSVTAKLGSTPDIQILADAIKKAKEVLARRAKEGVAGAAGGMKFSATIAAKAAELARIAAPVGDSKLPELFQLSYQWIYDSGASRHFCMRKRAEKFLHLAKKIKGIMIRTADGNVEAKDVVPFRIDRLGDLLSEVLVLPNSPALLSAGMLEKSGFSSIWAHGYMPCLVENKTGKLIVFDVCANLPMVMKGGVFDLIRDQSSLKKLCGVTVENGKMIAPCIQSYEDKVGQIYYGEVKETLRALREKGGGDYSAMAAAVGEALNDREEDRQRLEVTGFTTMVTTHEAKKEAALRRQVAGTKEGKYDVCEAFSFGTVASRAKSRGFNGGWSLGSGC